MAIINMTAYQEMEQFTELLSTYNALGNVLRTSTYVNSVLLSNLPDLKCTS